MSAAETAVRVVLPAPAAAAQLIGAAALQNHAELGVPLVVVHKAVELVAPPELSVVPRILDSAGLVRSSKILQYHLAPRLWAQGEG